MFSKSLGRVIRPSASPCPSARLSAATTLTAASRPPTPSEPRRYSSSKTSCPPGGARGSEQAANGTARTPADDSKRSAGRVTRRKGRDAAAEPAVKVKGEAFVSLPLVPPTNLQPADIKLSAFFSLHRPLSITSPIPPPSAHSTFNAIFAPRPSKSKTDDVIFTLSSAVSALESGVGGQSTEEKDLRWEVLNSQAPDGTAAHGQSLEELVKQFRPFNVPPVPVPFDEAVAAAAAQGKRVAAQQARLQRERELEMKGREEQASRDAEAAHATTHKTYKTTVTINETTSANGNNTYTFTASPLIEDGDVVDSHNDSNNESSNASLPTSSDSSSPSSSTTWPEHGQPFASRIRAIKVAATRIEEPSGGRSPKQMLLISVKRRRQLKMKKHKYKKLMKRTRNLRRSQGK